MLSSPQPLATALARPAAAPSRRCECARAAGAVGCYCHVASAAGWQVSGHSDRRAKSRMIPTPWGEPIQKRTNAEPAPATSSAQPITSAA